MLYTGYTLEELESFTQLSPEFIRFITAFKCIVCDPFILAERDTTLKFRGSRNQRIATAYINDSGNVSLIDRTKEFDEEQC